MNIYQRIYEVLVNEEAPKKHDETTKGHWIVGSYVNKPSNDAKTWHQVPGVKMSDEQYAEYNVWRGSGDTAKHRLARVAHDVRVVPTKRSKKHTPRGQR
jgi:hypothetical protein